MTKYLLGLFLIISQFSFTQTKIDTLKSRIEKSNTFLEKAKLYIDIANLEENPKKILKYADSALNYSLKSNSLRYQCLSYIKKGYGHNFEGHNDSAYYYYQKASMIIPKIDNFEILHKINRGLGYVHEDFKNIDSAYFYHQKAFEISKKLDKNAQLKSKLNLAVLDRKTGKTEKAIKSFLECLKLNDDKNLKQSISLYNSLGNLYLVIKNHSESEKYYRKAIKLAKKANKKHWVKLMELNLIQCVINAFKDEQGIELSKKFLKDHRGNIRDKEKNRVYFYLAQAHTHLKQYEQAKFYIQKKIEASKKIGDTKSLNIGKFQLATILNSLGEFKRAKDLLTEVIPFYIERNNIHSLISLKSLIISNNLMLKGDAKTSDLFEEYRVLKDSLYSTQVTSKVTELEKKYQTQQKENEILKLSNENIKKEAEAKAKSTQLNYALFGGSIILLLSLFLLRAYKKEKKTKEQILTQKKEIEVLHKELHHRVKNNLGIANSFIKVAKKNFTGSEEQNILEVLQSRIMSMGNVHELLYKQENVSAVNFQSYTERLCEEISNTNNGKANNISHKVNANIYIPIKEATPLGLILNETITNSYKYAFKSKESGLITINFKEDDTTIYCTISDNGIGMPDKKDYSNKNSYGTRLINSLVMQLSGTIQTTNNNGTHTQITFPKNQD
ncbi:tetratricopeptide repeat-containing sensor histidine kinase [Tenacibaculum xiamenense]|uniref:tetratricopeptide repeat-containing sensor histidine kinase n=1 Tax=Tenacibaculum xiamenense TaxID=1261553 RepID=UPI0038947413